MSTCTHEKYEPVEVRVTYSDESEVVAHICGDCRAQLPVWWGCDDCTTYEIQRLCDAVPTVRLGKPCRRHQERQ